MLRPVMIFRVSIIILLLWASAPAFAEAARLTFGAAPGATRALDSENQARRLATDLAEALDDEVSVRLFDDQLQLGQWLNQFAMIDLGVMDAAFLAAHPGEFLVLGSVNQEGQLFLVARQGATGDLPRRVAAVLHRGGGVRTPSPVTPPVATITPSAVDERPLVPGPPVGSVTPLVLGLVAGRDGVIHTPAQAEQLAAQLGKWLDVPVRVRLFDNEQVLADWFSRFRMIDLAIIAEPGRRDPLVGDYRPLQRLTAIGEGKGLLVARRDLPEARLGGAVQALAAFGRDPDLGEILATPVVEPPAVAAIPAPIKPDPPQPPVWPAAPVVSPVPEKPEEAPPVPIVPSLPDVPAEPPAPPPVDEPEEQPAPPVVLLPLSSVESFQMPASVGPVEAVDDAPEMLPPSAVTPTVQGLPESAPPVITAPPQAAASETPVEVVAEAPVPDTPAESAPTPPEAMVAETVPAAVPELPVIPVLPQVVEEVPPPAPSQELAAPAPEPAAAVASEPPPATVVEAPVPETPSEPAPTPPEAVVAEIVPAAVPELPVIPVPTQVVEEVPPPAPSQEPVAPAPEPPAAVVAEAPVPETPSEPAPPRPEAVVAEIVPAAIPELPVVTVPGETVAAVMPLVLGLVVDREGVIHTPVQAEQLAAHLGRLGVPVQTQLFDNEQELVNWFCRIRMIDLVVIDEPGRREPLVGEYCPQQHLAVTAGGKILLAARQYLPETRLAEVVRALDAYDRELSPGETPTAPIAEPLAVATPPAAPESGRLPESAAPVETVPSPAVGTEPPVAAVAKAPIPETPAVPVPTPREAVMVEPVPETVPELPFVPVPPQTIKEETPPVAGSEAVAVEESSLDLAGMNAVPDVIAQPDLPQELRPPGVPLPRPGRPLKATSSAEEPLLAKLQEPLGRTPKQPPLLPTPDPEPGVVYVAPFITLMVPPEVRERVFDQFIDTLNRRGADLKLKFVILKQGLDKVDRSWLGARKYALGEIFGYVEDSGCCSTDLRTRVRLTYYRAHQPEPALKFEYPVRVFFDHDRSTLTVERQKLADQIVAALVDELFKALQP